MYARQVGARTLTFGVSGQLWNRSLIMYDRETMTLWSHLLGRAMEGPLIQSELEPIPAVMTDWQSWAREHPDGTVLWMPRTSANYRRDFYQRPRDFVLGITGRNRPKAWSLQALDGKLVVNDQFDDQPVLVVFDRESGTARLYSRQIGDHTMTFEVRIGRITDRETNSVWDAVTGKAKRGAWNGQSLRPLTAIMSYRRAWEKFHPESEFVDP